MNQKNVKKKKGELIQLDEKRRIMKLTPIQRVILLGMLPQKDSYFNIKKVRQVREALAFNDAEVEAAGNVTIGTNTNWKKLAKQIEPKVIDFGEWLTGEIKDQLKKAYDEKELSEVTVDLYDIFIGEVKETK